MVNLCEVFYARSSPPTGVVFGLKRAFRLISNTCTQGGGGALVRVVGPRQGGGGALVRVVGPRQASPYLLYSFSEAVEVVLNETLSVKHLLLQQTDECQEPTDQQHQ